MAVAGIGIDHVDIEKFKLVLEKRKDRFLNRVFTEQEQEAAKEKNSLLTLAGKYAAKEAFFKAVGPSKLSGITWKDIEILNEKSGKPKIFLHGKALKIANTNKIKNIFISISHTDIIAMSQVLLETDE